LVVLDVGANIGVHTVCLARHMTGWGQVVAVEAQERVFYALCGNIALGNHFNARAICAAAGAADGWIDMPQPDYTAPASLGSFEVIKKTGGDTGQDIDYAAPSTRVRQMAIDSLALPRCDFIKLDCEGMEVEALAGARETIARFRPAMFIEVTKSDADGIKAAISDGYKVYPVSNGIVVMP
jgi:FkbM family methyltransferase